jgi:hypothetical protein
MRPQPSPLHLCRPGATPRSPASASNQRRGPTTVRVRERCWTGAACVPRAPVHAASALPAHRPYSAMAGLVMQHVLGAAPHHLLLPPSDSTLLARHPAQMAYLSADGHPPGVRSLRRPSHAPARLTLQPVCPPARPLRQHGSSAARSHPLDVCSCCATWRAPNSTRMRCLTRTPRRCLLGRRWPRRARTCSGCACARRGAPLRLRGSWRCWARPPSRAPPCRPTSPTRRARLCSMLRAACVPGMLPRAPRAVALSRPGTLLLSVRDASPATRR